MIASYDMQGKKCYGLVVKENPKSVRVWYKGRIIERKIGRDNVRLNAPCMRWDLFYYAEPPAGAAAKPRPDGPFRKSAQRDRKTPS